ncbi:hypothetical protein Fmac_011526 [Flemingia macrophylla]|uniref:PHD finger protein ALFIN-LIKE n=1 Tax=Flemingia macrophylla TaxID=520843 RepID=A0ABD1MMQ7_9FABA
MFPLNCLDPVLGINFARNMDRQDWFLYVAMHCTSWLLYVAYFLAHSLNHVQRYDIDLVLVEMPPRVKDSLKLYYVSNIRKRQRFFSLINDLPTVDEIVANWKPTTDQPSEGSASKSVQNTKKPKMVIQCGSCAGYYNPQEFWIGCDICEWWYHGKCVEPSKG